MSCGEGVRTRLVSCTENGTVVHDSVCLENIPIAKPPEEATCQGTCCNGMWTVQNWLKEVRIIYYYYVSYSRDGMISLHCNMQESNITSKQYSPYRSVHNIN